MEKYGGITGFFDTQICFFMLKYMLIKVLTEGMKYDDRIWIGRKG